MPIWGTGCGGTVVDSAGAETLIENNLRRNGEKVSSVDCPSGVAVDPGTTFECTVHLAGGERKVATVKIRDEKADIALIGLEKKASGE